MNRPIQKESEDAAEERRERVLRFLAEQLRTLETERRWGRIEIDVIAGKVVTITASHRVKFDQ